LYSLTLSLQLTASRGAFISDTPQIERLRKAKNKQTAAIQGKKGLFDREKEEVQDSPSRFRIANRVCGAEPELQPSHIVKAGTV
jgi:hypothetical protein